MKFDLEGKVVAITGGTAGIGLATALAFGEQGCKVAACSRSQSKVDNFLKQMTDAGYEAYARSVDVTDNSELKAFIHEVVEKFGRLDVLINNAGAQVRKPFTEYTEEDFYKIVNTDLKSVWFGCAFAAEEMRKTGGGVIINTTSFTATIPTCGIALYSACKAGVDSLTRTFASELAKDHIRVVGIQPGMTVTDLTRDNCEKNHDALVSAISMKRLATPADMVGGYLFLASDAAAYIDGFCLQITGGKFATQNPHYSYRIGQPGVQW